MDNSTSSTVQLASSYCVHKMPCGWCSLRNCQCPVSQGITITPAWEPYRNGPVCDCGENENESQ